MCSGGSTRALPRAGFPIRRSRGQRLVSTSPGLIAAAHVLLRLSAPRHPPCALVLLIRKNTCVLPLWSFQGARRRATVFQNSAARRRRGRHSFQASSATGRLAPSTGRAPTGVRAPVFPRKEVIQPQLPLRLPCYDFTPIIDPTFDGSLPYGLGHRLRVLPTFVV